jgi:hypothetical protein
LFRADVSTVSIVWELTAGASSSEPAPASEADDRPTVISEQVPAPRVPREDNVVPSDVLDALGQLSARYAVIRDKADALRGQGPFDDANLERGRRDRLVRLLNQMHELRHQRNVLLDAYDLPSTVGRTPTSAHWVIAS